MKTLIAFAFLAMSSTTFAYYNPFDHVAEEDCPGLTQLKDKYSALCADVPHAREIYNTSNSNSINLKTMPDIVEFLGAIELGLWPDADTNSLYIYSSILRDAKGNKVGYRVYHAYHNTEMESLLKVESRFNLAGKLVSISIDN